MFTTRPEIKGTFGVVSTTHWIAASVAMASLEKGGNAFDAAAAAAFTLQVIEPNQNGLGGDVPIIFWSAKRKCCEVICGQGPAPAGATIAHYRSLGLELVPGAGLLAAVVPGVFDGWMLLLRDHGTQPLRDVLEPAIHYARHGYPVSQVMSDTIARVAELFTRAWPSSAAVYLERGKAPPAGSLFKNPGLADTYERILKEAEAAGGDRIKQIEAARAAYYRGFVAEAIERFCRTNEVLDSSGRRHKGVLAAHDLARFKASYEDAAQLRLSRLSRGQDRPVGPRPGVPPAARPPRRLRSRGNGAAEPGVPAHRHRVRQARLCRSRGLVRRPRLRRGADGDTAQRGLQRRAPPPGERRSLPRAAPGCGRRARAAPAKCRPRHPYRRACGRLGGHGRAGPARRGGDGRAEPCRTRRRRQRHRARRRDRPLGQHGRGHAERRLAAELAGDPGARLLPRLARADVLARGRLSGEPGTGEAAAHDLEPGPRPARGRALYGVRLSGRGRPGPVGAPLLPAPPPPRPQSPGGDRPAEPSSRSTGRTPSFRASPSRAKWRSRGAFPRRRSRDCARAATRSRLRRPGRSAASAPAARTERSSRQVPTRATCRATRLEDDGGRTTDRRRAFRRLLLAR